MTNLFSLFLVFTNSVIVMLAFSFSFFGTKKTLLLPKKSFTFSQHQHPFAHLVISFHFTFSTFLGVGNEHSVHVETVSTVCTREWIQKLLKSERNLSVMPRVRQPTARAKMVSAEEKSEPMVVKLTPVRC